VPRGGGSAAGGWDLEEIRRRADIVDIVSPYVRLRKAGRRLVGLCPFHQERTPSFTVDPEKGFWHCFGCKAGGDLFRFVEMMEKVTFIEAVELLARRLGLPPRTPADGAQHRARERLLALHNEAAQFFHSCLKAKPGARALAYLQDRGVSPQSLDDFLLGYAPEAWDALLISLEKRGFSAKELARSGLAVTRQDGGFYDRFRNRVIFPIRDATGRVIAFGGRALADDQQPKYLNSPETMLFQKGQTLWAFDRARRAIADANRAIIVEGYLDAIACHEAGFTETVATMGTALTRDHVELLRRRVNRLLLAFDSDSAGLAAALRGREFFQEAGLDVWVVSLPEGMDPDNVIRLRGPDSFRSVLEAAAPMVEWELARLLAEADGKGERGEMNALRQAVASLARVPAGVEREYYIRWLAQQVASSQSPDRLKTMETAVREELARQSTREDAAGRRTPSAPTGGERSSQTATGRPAAGRVQNELLAALLHHGEAASRCLSMLEVGDFPDPDQRAVFEAIAGLVERGELPTAQAVLSEVAESARGLLAQLALDEVPAENLENRLQGTVRRIVEIRLRRRQTLLSQRLGEAISEQERQALGQELAKVARQRSELAGWRIIGED